MPHRLAMASRPTHAITNFIPHLPTEVWAEIFRKLDIESLLNVAEATEPAWKRLVFSPNVVQTVTFDQQTDEQTIKRFLLSTCEEPVRDKVENVPLASRVRELRFASCFTLSSNVILDCAQRCENLRELHCVNCHVEPTQLFRLLSLRLTRVTKLEWTLYEEIFYASRLDSYAVRQIEAFHKLEGPQLIAMYVEQTLSPATDSLLDCFLTRCPRLRHLHIHGIRMEHLPVTRVDACSTNFAPDESGPFEITHRIPSLETFRYTSEIQLSPETGTRIPVIRNNIAWQRKPSPYFNVIRLDDVAKQKVAIRRVEQAVVTVDANSQGATLFEEAAAKPDMWRGMTRLTVISRPVERAEAPTSPSTRHVCGNALGHFFQKCVSQLTELNLSTNHFAVGPDCCLLVASTLHSLRSLTLPPCGVNLKNSLGHLALGCNLLESLEIGSISTADTGASCEACKLPLQFTARCFQLLHEKTRLKRLSIDETAQIPYPMFLLGCRVEELRLSVDNVRADQLAPCPKELIRLLVAKVPRVFPLIGTLLAANPRLSCLTLVARRATLSPCFAATLALMKSVQHLCVLTTKTDTCIAVKYFLLSLESSLPRLLTAHVHYMSAWDRVQASTWLRLTRPDSYSGWRTGTSRTAKGVVLYDSPCLNRRCCVDSFTGLVRPRNRR